MKTTDTSPAEDQGKSAPMPKKRAPKTPEKPKEIGGPPGPDPTRFGDWEHNGRCIDF